MRLFVAEYLRKIRTDLAYFFRLAHQAKFGRDIDPTKDVNDYVAGGEPPPYVREYVIDIQQKEARHAVQQMQGTD